MKDADTPRYAHADVNPSQSVGLDQINLRSICNIPTPLEPMIIPPTIAGWERGVCTD